MFRWFAVEAIPNALSSLPPKKKWLHGGVSLLRPILPGPDSGGKRGRRDGAKEEERESERESTLGLCFSFLLSFLPAAHRD